MSNKSMNKAIERMENTINMLNMEIVEKNKLLLDSQIKCQEYEDAMDATAGGIDWKTMYFRQVDRAQELKIKALEANKEARKYRGYLRDKDNECEELREGVEELKDNYIKELEENKELKLKVKALEHSVKIYTENDTENLAEFCEMVNQDCHKLDEKNKKLVVANTELIRFKKFIHDDLVPQLLIKYLQISNDSGSPMIDDRLLFESKVMTDEEYEWLQDIVCDYNDTDWNDDNYKTKFNCGVTNAGNGHTFIEVEIDDDDDY